MTLTFDLNVGGGRYPEWGLLTVFFILFSINTCISTWLLRVNFGYISLNLVEYSSCCSCFLSCFVVVVVVVVVVVCCCWVFFVYWFFSTQSRIFHSYEDDKITDKGQKINAYIRSSSQYKQRGFFNVPQLLWQGTFVNNCHLPQP